MKDKEIQLEQLTRALEQSSARVMITDLEGRIELLFGRADNSNPALRKGSVAPIFASETSPLNGGSGTLRSIKQGDPWKGEVETRHRNGSRCWEFCSISPVRDDAGAIAQLMVVTEDITERKVDRERLWRQAHFDELTGLPNRTHLMSLLDRALLRQQKIGGRLSLLFVDLDRLRNVNDSFGHHAGDELLLQATDRLREATRPGEIVARFGGDNFAIVLPAISQDDARGIAQRILYSFSKPFAVGRESFVLTCTVGMTTSPEDGSSPKILVRNADTALNRGKEAGGNRMTSFEPEMNARIRHRLDMENALRSAIEREELSIRYQPIFDIAKKELVGFEALARWFHDDWGEVSPSQFIPVAEEAGLIGALGDWILRTACRQLQSWRSSGLVDAYMAVNISSRQCRDANFRHRVREILVETGLPGSLLALEVTESVLKDDLDHLVETVDFLRKDGVRICIDDFGTGYSSLGYLRRIPIDILKIDRSFVADIATSAEAMALPEAIIAMSHGLKLSVVAEGVENDEQLGLLEALGCDSVQGFLLSRPLAAEEVLRKSRTGWSFPGASTTIDSALPSKAD